MKNTLETRLGIFFALALVSAFIILEMVGGMDFFKRGHNLHARFKDVKELKVGDPVKMAGVDVGRVEAIGLDESRVKVTFRVKPDAVVKTDSKAAIKFTGLMGQNYLSLGFGTTEAPEAAPGAILETADQPDLSDIMARLDNVAVGIENVTKSFTGDKIDNLLGPITDFVRQNSPALTAAIGNMKTISDRVVAGEGTIGRLISEDTLYVSTLNAISSLETNLHSTSSEIQLLVGDARSAVESAKSVLNGINEGQGTLGKLAKDEKLYTETSEAMSNLKEILQKINRGEGSVGKLVNDDTFLKNIKMSLQKLDKATEGLEDTGPLNVLGTAVNSLF